ncbi:hypothetical protein Buap_1010 [Buchnera aphidicola str. APS (Acyrthosiphon pisum)]
MKKLTHHNNTDDVSITKVVAQLIPKAVSILLDAPKKGHKPRNFTRIKFSINILEIKNKI